VRQGAAGNSGRFSTEIAALPALDVAATTGDDGGSLRVAVINRRQTEPVAARFVRLPPVAHVWDLGAETDDVWATNSLDQPDRVGVADRGVQELPDGRYVFPPHSVTVLEWSL
jgi:alpha-L-arabinofuranosidase